MMKRKTKKCLLGYSLVIILVFAFSMQTFAATSKSNPKNTTVNGYKYTFYSFIESRKGEVAGGVSISANKTVPQSYMYAKSQIYTSGGSLKKSVGGYAGKVKGYTNKIYYSCKSGYYHAKGQVRFYTGKKYSDPITTYASPNLKPLSAAVAQTGYAKNKDGETYGSALYSEPGKEPDLIQAEGINGKLGYVRVEELDLLEVYSVPSEEVLNATKENRYISVYDLEGNVIDQFEILGTDDPEVIEEFEY